MPVEELSTRVAVLDTKLLAAQKQIDAAVSESEEAKEKCESLSRGILETGHRIDGLVKWVCISGTAIAIVFGTVFGISIPLLLDKARKAGEAAVSDEATAAAIERIRDADKYAGDLLEKREGLAKDDAIQALDASLRDLGEKTIAVAVYDVAVGIDEGSEFRVKPRKTREETLERQFGEEVLACWLSVHQDHDHGPGDYRNL